MSGKFITVVSIGEEEKVNLAFVRYETVSIVEQNANPLLMTIWTPVDGVLVGDATMFKNRLEAIYSIPEEIKALESLFMPHPELSYGYEEYDDDYAQQMEKMVQEQQQHNDKIKLQICDKQAMLEALINPHQNLEEMEKYIGVYFSEDEAREYGFKKEYTEKTLSGDEMAKKLRDLI